MLLSTSSIVVNSAGGGQNYASNVTVADLDPINTAVTLRDAIDAANNTGGDQTITFDASIFPSNASTTITLTGGTPLELSDTTGVVRIDGPGAAHLDVDAGGLSSVFVVDAGVTVAIDGLTISGGHASSGGGIYNSGDLMLCNDVISGNQAVGATGTDGLIPPADPRWGAGGGTGGDGLGGGIYNDVGASLSVFGSTFSTNQATGGVGGNGIRGLDNGDNGIYGMNGGVGGTGGQGLGGAIYAATGSGSLCVSFSTFSDNSATGGAGGAGGGAGNGSFFGGAGGDGGAGGLGAGGAIYIGCDNGDVKSSTLTANVASGGLGQDGQPAGEGAAAYWNKGSGAGGDGGAGDGGAIFNAATTTLTVTASTLAANQAAGASGGTSPATDSQSAYARSGGQGGAALGAGIANLGDLKLANSTLSGNIATGGAGGDGSYNSGGPSYAYGGDGGDAVGGIYNAGTFQGSSVTIAFNQGIGGSYGYGPYYGYGGSSTGGFATITGTSQFVNTIIGDNNASGSPDVSGTFSSQGHNLIGNTSGSSGWVESDVLNVDPKLGVLGNYGGPTMTVSLLSGSKAIDAGSDTAAYDASLTTDQRGGPFVRIAGAHVDIGAFEIQVIDVTSTADQLDATYDPANLTLRDAIALANANPDPDTIVFDPSLFVEGPATINLSLVGDATFGPTAFIISSQIEIDGPTGSNGLSIARDLDVFNLRLFYVSGGGNLTLNDLTLKYGLAEGEYGTQGASSGGGGGAGMGGAIFNEGTLVVQNSTLTGNTARGGKGSGFYTAFGTGGDGGGPNGGTGGAPGNPSQPGADGGFGSGGGGGGSSYYGGGNGGVGGFGGGGGGAGRGGYGAYYYAWGSGGSGGFGGGQGQDTSTGYYSYYPGNYGGSGGGGAGLGGAIFNYRGTVTITNSTLAGNVAEGGGYGFGDGTDGFGYGGGIFNLNGGVIITNATIAQNEADDGGGIYNLGDGDFAGTASLALGNAIVADSVSATNDLVNNSIASGSTDLSASGGNNLVMTNSGGSGVGITVTADPLLGPLAYNGGPTETMALTAGSPAIDAGDDSVAAALTTDQRGAPFQRVAGTHVDIGAFESQSLILVVTSTADQLDATYDPAHLTLRDAVALADVNPRGATITFDSSLFVEGPATIDLSLVGDTTYGPTAFVISRPVEIDGPTGTQGVTIERASSVSNLRLFYVDAGGSLTLKDLTLSDGVAQGADAVGFHSGGGGGGAAGLGGAILNQGSLTIERSTLSGNTATGGQGRYGGPTFGPGGGGAGPYPGTGGTGGANVAGTNGQPGGFASGGGGGGGGAPGEGAGGDGGFGGGGGAGGIRGFGGSQQQGGAGGFGGGAGGIGGGGYQTPGGTGGGGAGLGGAVFNYGGTVTITNSTLYGNQAVGGAAGNAGQWGGASGTAGKGYGGGVFNLNGSVTITNSTIAQNTADDGGGIYNLGDGDFDGTASLAMTSTIVANSITEFNDLVNNSIASGSTDLSGGFNLVMTNSGASGVGITVTADPLLGPLANNGGPTETMALLAGSPAINAGKQVEKGPEGSTELTTDQRGPDFVRIVGGRVDMGAFEDQLSDDTASESENATEGQAITSIVLMTFTSTDSEAIPRNFTANVSDWGGTLAGSEPTLRVERDDFYDGRGSRWIVTADSVTYAEAGTYTVVLTVNDSHGGTASTTNVSLDVADAALTDTTATTTINGTVGVASTNVTIMTFIDDNPSALNDFSVPDISLNWGGTLTGTLPTLTVSKDGSYSGPGSRWIVKANTVTYAAAGPHTVSLTVNDDDGATASTSAVSFNIISGDLVDITPVNSRPVSATEGKSAVNVVLATFTDVNPRARVSAFAGTTVNWGGTVIGTPKVTIKSVQGARGVSTWQVLGTVTYAEPGTCHVTVTIHDTDGSSLVSSRTSFQVVDAPLTNLTPGIPTISRRGHSTGNVVLATFIDANPYATTSDFLVNVDWGGTLVGKASTWVVKDTTYRGAGSKWNVMGNATYANLGVFAVNVKVADVDGSSVQTNGFNRKLNFVLF